MSNGSPPITTDPNPPAPGIPQPVIMPGGTPGITVLPPSLPPGDSPFTSDGWGWLPPPPIGEGGNAPFPTPVVPPGTGVSPPYITFGTGNASVPPASALFPSYSAPGPNPPVVLANIFNQGNNPPPFTPGTQPILISSAPAIPQLPWIPFPPPRPTNNVPPLVTVITPPPTVGGTIGCNNGTWTGSPTYTRQWYRAPSTPIPGAISNTYVLQAADEGASIYCIVRATNAGGSETAQSNTIGPVNPPAEADEARLDDNGGARAPHRTASPSHKTKKRR